jgi:hypothetical protein
MMQPIPPTHMVVDMTDYNEIKGAQSADVDIGAVTVEESTYAGKIMRTLLLPFGIKIVRRY